MVGSVVRGPDGSLRLQTSDGLNLPWALGEDSLANLGYEIPALPPPPGRTALVGDSDQSEGGRGNVPGTRTDVPREVPGAGGAGGAPGTQDQGGGVGAPAAPEMRRAEPEATERAPAPEQGANLSRFGAEKKSVSGVPGGQGAAEGPPAPRFTRIKGGDQRAGFNVQRGVDPETLEGVGESLGRATRSEITARDYEADRDAAIRNYQANQLESQIQDQRQKVDAGRARIQGIRQEQSDRQAEIDNERQKIASLEQDPHNYWAGQSTGAKIIAAIGALASGALQGLKGGPNQFMEHMKGVIADDLAAHRARINARKEGANLKQIEADKLYERMDPDLAERELEARELAISAAMVRQFAMKTGDPAIIARMQADADKLEADAKLRWAGISQEMGDRVVENWRYIPDQVIQTGGARAPKKPENLVRLPGGQYMFARDSTQARTAQQKIVANSRLAELSQRADALTNSVGQRVPTAAEKAQADTILSEMMFTYKDASQAGALDKGLQDAMGNYFGKATDLFRVQDVSSKLKEVGNIASSKVGEVIQYELHPDETYTSGPNMGSTGRRYEQ